MKPEIIQKMREEADAIAIKRRKEWWDSMTSAQQKHASRAIADAEMDEHQHLSEFKPGVIELDELKPPTPYSVQMQLVLVDVFVSLEDLADHTQDDLEEAALWAATVMFSASDNDVVIAPRPEWLPARDASGWDHNIEASGSLGERVLEDYAKCGGEMSARQLYDDDWRILHKLDKRRWYCPDCDEHYTTPELTVTTSGQPACPECGQEVGTADDEADGFAVGDLESQLNAIADTLIEVGRGKCVLIPKDLERYGLWLKQWVARGCPAFDQSDPEPDYEIIERDDPRWKSGRALVQDSPDTSVGEHTSTESSDGNAGRATDASTDGRPDATERSRTTSD